MIYWHEPGAFCERANDRSKWKGDLMSLHSFTHIALRVERLREAEAFYCDLFGLEVAWREAETARGWHTIPESAGWDDAARAGIELGIVMLYRDGIRIALERAESVARDSQLSHVGIFVDDDELKHLREIAARAGCDVVFDHDRAFVLDDPFGVRWELNSFAYDDPPSMSTGARTGRWLEVRPARGGEGANPTPTPAVPSSPQAYDGLIVDLDGVVWRGSSPIDGAADAIASLRAKGVRLVFLTNDPQGSAAEQAARLSAIGIPASPSEVLTSPAAAARYLASRTALAGSELLAIGPAALHDELRREGFRLVAPGAAHRARAVVVAAHERFDYAELVAATTAVLAGAELYATGRDPVYPTADGPRPATGAILAAVETATSVTATVLGKPEPYMFEIARRTLGPRTRVAVVGDHLVSDIAGAKRAGLDAILVLSGSATEDELSRAPIQPDLVLPSLAVLASGACRP